MLRLLQSTLFPGNSTQWLDALKASSRIVALSSAHPTFLVALETRENELFVRHELVFGLFRTVWTSPAALDLGHRRLTCKGSSKHFQTIEQVLCWEESERGLSIQSELVWSGASSSLEDLILRSILRFPNTDLTPSASERPTQRIAMEGQSAA